MLFVLGSSKVSAQNDTISSIVDSIYYKGQVMYKPAIGSIASLSLCSLAFYDINKDLESLDFKSEVICLRADKNGEFCVKLPAKDYNIEFFYLGFESEIVQAIIPKLGDSCLYTQNTTDSTMLDLGEIVLYSNRHNETYEDEDFKSPSTFKWFFVKLSRKIKFWK